jgi:hypothetical protein
MSAIALHRSPIAFANGFDCFCTNCGNFFSAQIEDSLGGKGEAFFCPQCGEGDLETDIPGLVAHCEANHADTVNFYSAFPPGEPIPHSRTGATPDQVKWIIGCRISDIKNGIWVTAESMAASLGYDIKIVGAVFEELHL